MWYTDESQRHRSRVRADLGDYQGFSEKDLKQKPLLSERFLLDDLLSDAGENFRMFGSKLCEDFTVERKTGLLQLCDERTVGLVTIVADSGVEAHDPKLTEIGLLVTTVGEGVAACAHERLVCVTLLLRADASVALGPLEDILAAFLRHNSTFDSCHTEIIKNIN